MWCTRSSNYKTLYLITYNFLKELCCHFRERKGEKRVRQNTKKISNHMIPKIQLIAILSNLQNASQLHCIIIKKVSITVQSTNLYTLLILRYIFHFIRNMLTLW